MFREGGYSLVAVLRFFIVAASLAVEHRLQGMRASVVVAPRFINCGA